MSKLPKGLTEKQEKERQKTINLVLRAIAGLKAEGYSVKIKDLIEATGLSRSVFAKPHIRKILVDNAIGHSKADASVSSAPVHKSSQIANHKEKLTKKKHHFTRKLSPSRTLFT
jgi:hypothetical protein